MMSIMITHEANGGTTVRLYVALTIELKDTTGWRVIEVEEV